MSGEHGEHGESGERDQQDRRDGREGPAPEGPPGEAYAERAHGHEAGHGVGHEDRHDHRHEPDGEPRPDGEPDGEGDAAYWDARYGASERIWSGKPNAVLVREVEGLKPGRALDLGCGEGADAIWLAEHGWSVVAVDISQVALDRAEGHCRDAGLSDRVHWQRHDLAQSFPSGSFDLVSAHFLHSPFDMPRDRILRDAAAAVARGGVLLVAGHAAFPPWAPHQEHHDHVDLPTPHEVYDGLALASDAWELLTAEEHEQPMQDQEGRPAIRRDNLLKLRRLM
ncbi:class I SAM-dependent methyltransferase [Streptomyces sp. V4-01]|uniref:Class I SAM-dependent methyltransferase n=1 Tax=Actinacidiphila polyblastidii TaxID=3110430 RepID=A0ABU7PLG4_9ACTN|nr:class I SAM-dependent methyltransferase [Streptomyces sp. V4-01]